jgi:hypothetical protein
MPPRQWGSLGERPRPVIQAGENGEELKLSTWNYNNIGQC